MDRHLPQPQHLLDLIRQVRPQAALFTTYTFSVSHFDTVFVPVLRSVGCQDIAVLVDADQASYSTEESKSRAAGRVYRLAPVIAPGGGVFHPKLAYLVAASGDVLAVSSANLTASGQSLQLESFDSVHAASASGVFRSLADWLEQLSELVKESSPQASALLAQMAPRARRAYRVDPAPSANALPQPALVHTLNGAAREALEALFLAEADKAESVVVLSPFHSPDGGPVLRLAASLQAHKLSIGLDGSRPKLVAPFEQGRFTPSLPSSFVKPDTQSVRRRLHAKVFELYAANKVLVMTGSVNATAQSFESSQNIEASLARWLPKSPFSWADAKPLEYEATQKKDEFKPVQSLYVDAWLDTDRIVQGRVTSRSSVPASLKLTLHQDGQDIFSATITPSALGEFNLGGVPAFDTSQATLLTVRCDQASASCWLNVYEELEVAAEERERRAAVGRVLGGGYALEDVAEVIRLLTVTTRDMAAQGPSAQPKPTAELGEDREIPFSFTRWKNSGQRHAGVTLLGRTPNELLRAITRWLNRDLEEIDEPTETNGASQGKKQEVQLQKDPESEKSTADGPSGYQLLDQLCQAIPVALGRQPDFEHAGVLAEVVASRAIDLALRQELQMAPCVAWIDRYSRFSYPTEAQGDIRAIACAMACVAAYGLEHHDDDPQLAVLREGVERFVGSRLREEQWAILATAGLERPVFRRVPAALRESANVLAARLSRAPTLRDMLLTLLRASYSTSRHSLTREPEARTFPDVAAVLQARRPRKPDLLRGLLKESDISRKVIGCPFCYSRLPEKFINTLQRTNAVVHKELNCNRIVMLADESGLLAQGIVELPDA